MTVRLVFTCPVCLVDFDEPACEICGRSLMPALKDVDTEPVPGWWGQLFDDVKEEEKT